jgi:hypothetical protein
VSMPSEYRRQTRHVHVLGDLVAEAAETQGQKTATQRGPSVRYRERARTQPTHSRTSCSMRHDRISPLKGLTRREDSPWALAW